jgi:hypothetical protein
MRGGLSPKQLSASAIQAANEMGARLPAKQLSTSTIETANETDSESSQDFSSRGAKRDQKVRQTSTWLNKYMEEFVGKTPKTVLVPLCGISLDITPLLRAGHRIVAANCTGKSCTNSFLGTHNIRDYDCERVELPEGKHVIRIAANSVPLVLYEGEAMELTPEVVGPIDAFLDMGTLAALPLSKVTSQYLPLIKKLLSSDGKMLLSCPKCHPHNYESNAVKDTLSKFFSEIKQQEVLRYRVNQDLVLEPVYLVQ